MGIWYYETKPLRPATHQLTLDDVLGGEIENLSKYLPKDHWTSTRTDYKYANANDFSGIPSTRPIYSWMATFQHLIKDDMSEHYREFKIPKAKGGYRTIDDPDAALREAQTALKKVLESYGASYHTAAFAYVKGRCAKDAVEKHRQNGSNWCLRTDFSNFFGSITHEFLCKMVFSQWPFCAFSGEDQEKLKTALKICFLRGGLPQGSTISPMLTNLIMIPIDYTLANMFWKQDMVYSRYADDIQVSAYRKFNYREVVEWIDDVLKKFDTPFRIKPEKTKFSSVNGINYMLGLMLNNEHKITVGHERKKAMKAMIANFFCDYKSGKRWPIEEVQHMNGIVSYYKHVEEAYITYVVEKLENKFGLNYKETVKACLS